MRASDEHLEQALKEYNDKISALEVNGTDDELLEALVNRSTILMLLGSYTASMTDAEEAIELSKGMKDVDIGTFVKMYENRGQMIFDDNEEMMVSDYSMIISRLDEIHGEIRHYDWKGLIMMCQGCAEDLIDCDRFEMSVPFTQKALELMKDASDIWSMNRKMEIQNLIGQADTGMGLDDNAIDAYSESILIGEQLYDTSRIEDPIQLVFAYVYRGDIMEAEHEVEKMWNDHESALVILEELNNRNRLSDPDLLIKLHQSLASSMMESGEIERAEKHLMRAINLGVPGIKDAIDEMNSMR